MTDTEGGINLKVKVITDKKGESDLKVKVMTDKENESISRWRSWQIRRVGVSRGEGHDK